MSDDWREIMPGMSVYVGPCHHNSEQVLQLLKELLDKLTDPEQRKVVQRAIAYVLDEIAEEKARG